MFNDLYKKCLDLAAHKSSKYYLAIVSFVESSFFPIPPDVMIIPMVISKKNDFIKIFLIAKIFSVLGGMLWYLIEGGQRPVTAAPPFWVMAVWGLAGMAGRVYARTVSRCNR